MVNYVFDVDGTLTPSRGEFHDFFSQWLKGKNVYFLTGSDAEKTIEQVGKELWSQVVSYQCGGNEIYAFGKKVYELDWDPHKEKATLFALKGLCDNSEYPKRFGNHIELRKGMINFSVVGRNCSLEERKAYFEWDKVSGERKTIAELIPLFSDDLEASIGGEISIDICLRDKDKGQVYNFLKDDPIYFFGDRTEAGGNDYSLAKLLKSPHKVFQVEGPEDTMKILQTL